MHRKGWKGAVALAAFSAALIGTSPVGAKAADPAPSAELQAKLAGLTAAQKAFIDDPATLQRFGMSKEKLYKVLDLHDAAGVQAAVQAMMETVAAAKFQAAKGPVVQKSTPEPLNPDSDMAAVELNPQAGDFNGGTVLRPAILDDVQRDPGPFSLKRYVGEKAGIPTFANAPVAVRKEDLVAGKVDVAFVGVPLDLSSGWRDSQNAPNAMRAMYGIDGFDVSAGLDPTTVLTVVDYGDLRTDKMSVELTVDHVRQMIGEMVDAGTVPFVVGGDHSIMFPTVAAMADKYGADKISVVHLDAHFNGERDLDHTISDRQAVSRLLQDGLVKGKNVVQVGIRGGELTKDDLGWMQQQGVRMHSMAEVEGKGWQKVLEATLAEARSSPDNVFISFDISVLDPAYGQGAGRPAADGLTMREAVPLIRRLCAETHVVGFEMLDVAPYLDISYATALNANAVMHACLTGIAMRKQGITETAYLDPQTANGGK